MQKYYEEYIFSVIEGKYEDKFGRFEDLFVEQNYADDMKRLKNAIGILEVPKRFPSIINMDIYFFGLIYQVLFKHNDINKDHRETLRNNLKRQLRHLGRPQNMLLLRLKWDIYASELQHQLIYILPILMYE